MRCFYIPRRKGTKLFAHLQILSNFESRILNYEVEKGKVQGKYWMVIEWDWSGIEVVLRKKAER